MCIDKAPLAWCYGQHLSCHLRIHWPISGETSGFILPVGKNWMKHKPDQISLPSLSAPSLYLITSFLKNGGGLSPLHQSFLLALFSGVILWQKKNNYFCISDCIYRQTQLNIFHLFNSWKSELAYISNLEWKWIRTNENPAVDLMRKTNNLSPFK